LIHELSNDLNQSFEAFGLHELDPDDCAIKDLNRSWLEEIAQLDPEDLEMLQSLTSRWLTALDKVLAVVHPERKETLRVAARGQFASILERRGVDEPSRNELVGLLVS
jgi:hypothetical protein